MDPARGTRRFSEAPGAGRVGVIGNGLYSNNTLYIYILLYMAVVVVVVVWCCTAYIINRIIRSEEIRVRNGQRGRGPR